VSRRDKNVMASQHSLGNQTEKDIMVTISSPKSKVDRSVSIMTQLKKVDIATSVRSRVALVDHAVSAHKMTMSDLSNRFPSMVDQCLSPKSKEGYEDKAVSPMTIRNQQSEGV
jgi:hypothetical protein